MLLRAFFTPARLAFFGLLAFVGYVAFKPEDDDEGGGKPIGDDGMPPETYSVSPEACNAAFDKLSDAQKQEISDTIYDAAESKSDVALNALAAKYEATNTKTGKHVGACLREAAKSPAITGGDLSPDASEPPEVKSALNTLNLPPPELKSIDKVIQGNTTWPAVRALSEPYRTKALDVLRTVVYSSTVNPDGGPPCWNDSCDSGAIVKVMDEIRNNAGFGTEAALAEMRAAVELLRRNEQ